MRAFWKLTLLYYFATLILIIDVHWYDTQKENFYFIWKVIDKDTHLKLDLCDKNNLQIN